MPPVMQSVYSSHVGSVGYDAETRELHVEWYDTGKTSVYSGVPPEVGAEAASAWSVGQYLTQNVKGRYSHRYLG